MFINHLIAVEGSSRWGWKRISHGSKVTVLPVIFLDVCLPSWSFNKTGPGSHGKSWPFGQLFEWIHLVNVTNVVVRWSVKQSAALCSCCRALLPLHHSKLKSKADWAVKPSRSSDFETSRLRRWPRFTGQAIAFKSSYTLVVCLFSISSFSCVLSLSFYHCSFSNTTLFQTQKFAHRSMASLFSG